MKSAFILSIFVALAAAMPQADPLLKRESPSTPPDEEPKPSMPEEPKPVKPSRIEGLCSIYNPCPDGKVCIGDHRLYGSNNQGFCVDEQVECEIFSTDIYKNECPGDYACIPRANKLDCPSCGLCLAASSYQKVKGLQPYFCASKEPKMCFEDVDPEKRGKRSTCLNKEFWKEMDTCPEHLTARVFRCGKGDSEDGCDSNTACRKVCPEWDLSCINEPGSEFCIPKSYLERVSYSPPYKPKPKPSGSSSSSCTNKVTVTVTSMKTMKPVVRVKTVISRVTVTSIRYKYSNKKNDY
ncbi:hypothetical protein AOL_s00080g345 [Orbilia oligospora ATCC 24927]|uniref:Uncharacterized protein n=2 Tax=Orbilia oligospora TaxID=2813651 RepID=G1XEW0_ARTOA|nr:hypothetical protein AOL_s00080g345 [Orbilia oligospora ATCC 24927]EGX48220.1 hypothetical protein AOL_s00080g345 [Orbilia oligospora ATCC 24927]KAF3282318.1 hypothetical protein TWF970_001728 [Orbilia oligospora]